MVAAPLIRLVFGAPAAVTVAAVALLVVVVVVVVAGTGACAARDGDCGCWAPVDEDPPPVDSHWSSRTMDGSDLAPSINSSSDKRPSEFLSICLNIFSVLRSGVDSSSGIIMVVPIIL